VERLPLWLIVGNNQYAYSTAHQTAIACRSLLDKSRRVWHLRAEVDGNRFGRLPRGGGRGGVRQAPADEVRRWSWPSCCALRPWRA